MKYIGQYVYDLIARFRGDVYINSDLYLQQAHTVISGGYDGGTSSQDRILYLDPNGTGKVTHSSDFEYDTDNEILSIGDADTGYATIRRVGGSGTNTPGGNLAIEAGYSTGSSLGGLVYLGTSTAGSSGSSVNSITEKLTLWPINDASGFAGDGSAFSGLTNPDYTQVTMPGSLGIYADTSGDLGSHPHIVFGPRTTTAHPKSTKLSEIEAKGNNSAQELISYSLLRTRTGGGGNNDDTDEHGIFDILVATSDGSTSALRNAFSAGGHATNNDVDISLGYGSTSITTVNGFLSLGGHSINDIDIAGEFVDSDEHIMTSAAINDRINAAAGDGLSFDGSTANGLLTYKDADEITVESNATYDGTDLTLTSSTSAKPELTIQNSNTDAVGSILKFEKTATGANLDKIGKIQFQADDNADQSITFAEIEGSIYNATAAGSAQTGQLQFQLRQSGSLANVLKSYSLGFGSTLEFGDGGVLATAQFNCALVNFTSSTSTGPIFAAENNTEDANGPEFTFVKKRGGLIDSTATLDNDNCGTFNFRGFDDGANVTTYADIKGYAVETSDGNEAGKIQLRVTSDGNSSTNSRNGITCTGHTTTDKVDVDLGYGSASTVTIPGGISIGGHTVNDIDVAGEFVDSDEHLMTAAAINDRIAAAGGSVSVSDSTADTDFPVVFHDESNNLHDDTGAFTYNPSTGDLKVTGNITVGSTSNDQYEITLSNDENTAQIGLSNSSNDFVNGAQDGDLVINSVGDHQIIFAQNDTSCARLDTDGKFVGVPHFVKLSKDDLYLTYVSTQNYYYSFGAIGLNFGTSIGSEADSSAIRSCSFIAPYQCTVNKVTIAFYITSSCTLEFYFGKVQLVDDSTSNVSILPMTSTDHNGSYTANKNYVKSFDISGPNAILSEGHGLAIFARRTDASGTSIIYGNAFGDIRII